MALLWHGTLTARRYSMACTRCGKIGAAVDTDAIGRTIVRCGCSPAPFVLVLSVGGAGQQWPIDVSGLAELEAPPKPAAPGVRPRRAPEDVRRCATAGCTYAVGPRAVHCGKCSRAAASSHKCRDCDASVDYRATRCPTHAHTHNLARKARMRREARRRAKETQ